MTAYHLAAIDLAAPISVRLPSPRNPATGAEKIISQLKCAFYINVHTQTIHAQISLFPKMLLIYGPEDFAAVAADLPEHHAARVLQVLGSDIAAALQALCDGTPLPPLPVRVPREIANWRARAVLDLAGLLPAVEALIGALSGAEGIIVRHAWQSGAPLARTGPSVAAITPALGLSQEQVDGMFIQAALLAV
jgi:hypothetical protein